jgi:hypothetical protein
MIDPDFLQDFQSGEAEDASYFGLNRREDADVFYLNQSENAIDSLETAASFLARSDNLKWKWVAIALHHSLYSFCISCLENGNYDNVVSKGRNEDDHIYSQTGDSPFWMKSTILKHPDSPAYTIKWVRIEGEPPSSGTPKPKPRRQELIGFWVALARVQDQHFWMGRLTVTKALHLSDDEWESIEWLTNEVRNGCLHFIPKGLSVSIESVRRASIDIVRAIEFLALNSFAVVYAHHKESTERVRKAIADIRGSIQIEVRNCT